MTIQKAIMLLFVAMPFGAFAADWKSITGTYAVTAEHYLDPSHEEPRNSHFRVQLTGNAAKDLYLAIPGDPSVDQCTGGQVKSAGELQCLFFNAGSKYECAFSIDLLESKVEYGVAC